MKLLTTFAFSLLFFGSIFAQDIDNRLLKSYSEVELAELKDGNPEQYDLLIYAIDNATYITAFPEGKTVENSITIVAEEFNYLDLNLKIENQNQYYKIIGTNNILVVKSFFVLNNELKTKK